MQEMSIALVHRLGTSRFLKWEGWWRGANARRATSEILVYGIIELRVVRHAIGVVSFSHRSKSCVEGFFWIFMGVYNPTSQDEKESLWAELGGY